MFFQKVCSYGLTNCSSLRTIFTSAKHFQYSSNIEKTINQVTLLGRAGAEPQKRGSDDHPVVIFSVATHVNYKNSAGELIQKTDWHRICVFKPFLRNNVFNFLKKGQRVYVSGKLMYGEVKDEAGNSHSTTSVLADDVIFFQTGS